MNKASESVRMSILLPADLVEDLRRYVPPRQRARFVAQAVACELRRLRLEKTLEASAGAWQDADHPELADGPAIDRWIAEGRARLDWDRPAEAYIVKTIEIEGQPAVALFDTGAPWSSGRSGSTPEPAPWTWRG